jgi:putative hydrolase of the HAD superfamily
VLLTNGRNSDSRTRSGGGSGLDDEEMNRRRHLTFDTYEEGKLNREEFLNGVVPYLRRTFSPKGFKAYRATQSRPLPKMELCGARALYNAKASTTRNLRADKAGFPRNYPLSKQGTLQEGNPIELLDSELTWILDWA